MREISRCLREQIFLSHPLVGCDFVALRGPKFCWVASQPLDGTANNNLKQTITMSGPKTDGYTPGCKDSKESKFTPSSYRVKAQVASGSPLDSGENKKRELRDLEEREELRGRTKELYTMFEAIDKKRDRIKVPSKRACTKVLEEYRDEIERCNDEYEAVCTVLVEEEKELKNVKQEMAKVKHQLKWERERKKDQRQKNQKKEKALEIRLEDIERGKNEKKETEKCSDRSRSSCEEEEEEGREKEDESEESQNGEEDEEVEEEDDQAGNADRMVQEKDMDVEIVPSHKEYRR
ncbi:unnamed protein product [Trichogramma brassicae]|uniref:Uncharacterized protein n=1 Tax=Trichogramma brassicae TaxID=86971 RepID=A0A6H5ICV3_9HYME|nr:unnamed protein product [Trichogramma brassicae]